MEPISIEVKLNNGDFHTVNYDEGKEKFLDLVRFGEGVFIENESGDFFAVKNIISFKFKKD